MRTVIAAAAAALLLAGAPVVGAHQGNPNMRSEVTAITHDPALPDFDSSEPAATAVDYGMPLLGGMALFVVVGFLLLLRRARRRLPPPGGLTRRGYGGHP